MNKKQTAIGTVISLNVGPVSSRLYTLGFDFLFIDLEHGDVNDATIAMIVMGRKNNSKVLIRIAEISERAIKHALDLGCDGIVAPRLETVDELRILIDYSFYPPIGKRSVGFTPANNYGLNLKDYAANFKPMLLPQVESIRGLEMAQDVINDEHIAGVFLGPYDLSMSLGIPGQFNSGLFKDAEDRVRKLCTENKKYFGTFAANIQAANEEIRKGTDMVAIGVDANLLLNCYLDIIEKVKKE